MNQLTRRDFTRLAAAAGTTGLMVPTLLADETPSPGIGRSDDIRIAVVGIRGRGQGHFNAFQRIPGVEVVALCDIDSKILAERAKAFNEKYDRQVDTEVDFRRVLDRKDIDAVSLATPNHWHALQTIWACEAGKDVYVEKPVCHNLQEGQAMVAAARRNARIVQTGTQNRSNKANHAAIEWVRNGNLGDIQLARGICYKPRKSIGKVDQPQSVPEHIDYDLWVGPAPMTPLNRRNIHYDWHWDQATGNGDLGNQGIHQMDVARWMLGRDTLPRRVMSVGGRLGYDDDGNTPNTQVVVLDYEDAPLLFEVRGLPRNAAERTGSWGMDRFRGTGITAVLHCEGGDVVTRHGTSPTVVLDPDGQEIIRFSGADNHFVDFIEAVRTRDQGDLEAEIEEGRCSSSLCHIGSISYQLGEPADETEILASVQDHPHAREAIERMMKHLKANEIDVTQPCLSGGPWLTLDPATERFESAAANALTHRTPRSPYTHESLQ